MQCLGLPELAPCDVPGDWSHLLLHELSYSLGARRLSCLSLEFLVGGVNIFELIHSFVAAGPKGAKIFKAAMFIDRLIDHEWMVRLWATLVGEAVDQLLIDKPPMDDSYQDIESALFC